MQYYMSLARSFKNIRKQKIKTLTEKNKRLIKKNNDLRKVLAKSEDDNIVLQEQLMAFRMETLYDDNLLVCKEELNELKGEVMAMRLERLQQPWHTPKTIEAVAGRAKSTCKKRKKRKRTYKR